jgi:hypothetical protein
MLYHIISYRGCKIDTVTFLLDKCVTSIANTTTDMAPPSTTSSPLACMAEIQEQCFKMGIPLRTR